MMSRKPKENMLKKTLLLFDRLQITVGPVVLGLVIVIYTNAIAGSQPAIAATEVDGATERVLAFNMSSFSPDQSMWSDKARAKFEKVKNDGNGPLAVIAINRLNIKGPVFEGTDRKTLDRGIGVVEGTVMPGEVGNVALSAHRDSYFRPLKDVILGDRIELRTQNGVLDFEVSEITIVDSQDISVLDQTDTTVLTLITCYPFYYVGYAPDRFIVRAIPVES
jgi:sortase A